MNVVIAPNALIGEWLNCFESVPGANVQWWSQCMDGRSGWSVMVAAGRAAGWGGGKGRRGVGVGCVGMGGVWERW